MTGEAFGKASWDERWARVLEASPDKVAGMPPNATFVAETRDLTPGRALDAGCGHGSEAIWLAASDWQVTAVDFSVTALDIARSRAEAAGSNVGARIAWVEGDLGAWVPEPGAYDLVSCLYVHVVGSVVEMVRRLAAGVGPGGTLLLVGHRPVDPATGEPSLAAGQVQVSVAEALQVLGPPDWDVLVAEERRRQVGGDGVDAVVKAVRTA